MNNNRPPLDRLVRRLQELALAHDQLILAISSDDIPQIRNCCDMASRRQSAVNHVNNEHPNLIKGLAVTRENLVYLKHTKNAYERIGQGCEAYRIWSEKRLSDHPSNRKDVTKTVDRLLDPSWDRLSGLIIISGTQGESLASQLTKRGQRAVILFNDQGVPSGDVSSQGVQTVDSERELFNLMMSPALSNKRAVKVHALPSSPLSEEALLKTAHKNLAGAINFSNSVESRGQTWAKHCIANLSSIAKHPSVHHLAGTLKGIPAVIVSPGPSLKKNIDTLRSIKANVIVIASNRTFKPLIDNHIVPDFVLCGDPIPDLIGHIEGISQYAETRPVFSVILDPKLFESISQPAYTFTTGEFQWLFDILDESGTLHSAGSIATTAFQLAILMGCNPIALVGQDLAFTNQEYYMNASMQADQKRVIFSEDGKSWKWKEDAPSDEHMPAANAAAANRTVLQVKGWHQDQVPTSIEFIRFRDWFEAIAPLAKAHAKLFNCTEGGAWLEGFEHIPLSAFKAKLNINKQFDRSSLDLIAKKNFNRPNRLEHIKGFCRSLLKDIEALGSRLDNLTNPSTPDNPTALSKQQEFGTILYKTIQKTRFLSITCPNSLRSAYNQLMDATTKEEGQDAFLHFLTVAKGRVKTIEPDLKSALDRI